MSTPTFKYYSTVTGQFLVAVQDSSDPDSLPEFQPLQGRVTFTPAAGYFLNHKGDTNPYMHSLGPIVGLVGADGYLRSTDGTLGVSIPATDDPDFEPVAWTYRVVYDLYTPDGKPVRTLPRQNISAPSGRTVDLIEQMPKPVSDGVYAIQGPQGLQGPQGPVGNKGDRGPRGETGEKGPTGSTGPKGDTGPQGSKGDTGADSTVPGPRGERGVTGPQGPKGDKGADSTVEGPRGLTGPQGPAGPQGPKGADSTVEGPTGPRGLTGPAGPKGDKGADSTVAGPQGPTGPRGETGPVGPKGDVGPQGIKGSTGATGSTGPAGPIGPQGIKGDTGASGTGNNWFYGSATFGPIDYVAGKLNGDMLLDPLGRVYRWTNDSSWVSTGLSIKGETGPVGSKWYFGTTAPNENGAYRDLDFYLDTASGKTYRFVPQTNAGSTQTAAYWQEIGNLKGPAGPKGDTGAASTVAGPAGATGPKGDTGPAGPQGPKGDTGAKGETGSQGPKGDTGAAGTAGATGPQGPKGDTGATGPKGDTGSQGPKGADGVGINGGRVFISSTAPANPQVNDIWIN